MHEVGHLLLHRSSVIDDVHDIHSGVGQEREANELAGRVLVPDTFLQHIDDSIRPRDVSDYGAWLSDHRKAWGVSGETILIRLMGAGRLARSSYEAYIQWRNARVELAPEATPRLYRHREPKHVFGDSFVRTVLDARSADQISLAKAASYLDGLKLKDFHKLEQYYEGL
jgi:Zn-dependent peptidase ImmA (M78 family)